MNDTRLWLSGVPVEFVKWTPRGLVYVGLGSQETLTNLSRGMVKRMLRDGLLRIEGYMPDWVVDDPHNDRMH